jgi:hypothetical protein
MKIILTRVLSIYRLSKALSYSRTSYKPIPMGDNIYILAFGVAKSSLVGRGYIFDWKKDYKA